MTTAMTSDPAFHQALAGVASGVIRAPVRIGAVREDAPGPQGASGGVVRSFTVTYQPPDDGVGTLRIVSKEAWPLERRVLALLSAQRQAIPVTWVEEMAGEGKALVVQEYSEELPSAGAFDPLTERTAEPRRTSAWPAGGPASSTGTRPTTAPSTSKGERLRRRGRPPLPGCPGEAWPRHSPGRLPRTLPRGRAVHGVAQP